MDTPNVQPGTPPGYCGAIADELHRIADALAAVEHLELPEPRYVHLHIQPGGKTDDEVIAAVNALGQAVVGKPGTPDEMGGGSYHYAAEGDERAVYFRVYRQISPGRARSMDPNYQPDERDAELARLRAEVEQLRAGHPSWPTESELKPWESLAQAADRVAESMEPVVADPTGLNYGRGDEQPDPQPKSGRVPPHYGEVTDVGLVVEDDAGSLCNGAPAGFEADCGRRGAHGPHPLDAR